MSGRGFIAHETERMCEMCGTIAECRPYGPNYEQICFDCGTTKVDVKILEERFAEYVLGETDS